MITDVVREKLPADEVERIQNYDRARILMVLGGMALGGTAGHIHGGSMSRKLGMSVGGIAGNHIVNEQYAGKPDYAKAMELIHRRSKIDIMPGYREKPLAYGTLGALGGSVLGAGVGATVGSGSLGIPRKSGLLLGLLGGAAVGGGAGLIKGIYDNRPDVEQQAIKEIYGV